MDQALQDIAAELDASNQTEEEQVVEPVVELSEESVGAGDGVEIDGQEPAEETDDDIKTLSQLAEAIEVEPEYLYGIEIAMGEKGETVPLGELKDQYQAVTREKAALEQQLQDYETQLQDAQSGVQHGQQLSDEIMTAYSAITKLNQDYADIDWAEYEKQDPGAAALSRQKFQEAMNQAQGNMSQAQQQQGQQQEQVLRVNAQEILKVIPEWQNEEVRNKERGELTQMLASEGYAPNTISLEGDPIATRLARELMQLRAEKSAATAAVQKVHNAPKVLKGRGKFAQQADVSSDLVAKAKKSGSKKDELNAVKSILSGR